MPEEVFESDINLQGNQLKNVVVDIVATDPVTPLEGQFWYNQTTGRLKYRDNGTTRIIPFLGIDGNIEFILFGGGITILTGIQGEIIIPFNCQIKSVNLLSDQTGSIVVDILKSSFSNYPGGFNTITAAAIPQIINGIKYEDNILTGWTINLLKDDVLRFDVQSSNLISRLLISLKIIKT